MTPFERQIEKSFAEYKSSRIACLMFLYPKMRMAGHLKNTPAFVQVAKSPYDISGYYYETGRYIACELKESSGRETSLPMIAPGKRGTGLQYHQLEALVDVHDAGGLACLVWNNGGEIGYLDGSRLKAAKSALDTSIEAERLGLPNATRGQRSILWGNFQLVHELPNGVPLWLPKESTKKTGT